MHGQQNIKTVDGEVLIGDLNGVYCIQFNRDWKETS